MKKFVLLLLAFVTAIVSSVHMSKPATAPKNNGTMTHIMSTVPLMSSEKDIPAKNKQPMKACKPAQPLVIICDPIRKAEEEQDRFCDDIPLTDEEQDCLQAACEEFGVPYALALGLIEKETSFQNIAGDGGASAGYMQIQKRWHSDRMERLGVTDLMDSNGNFRVGCDLLSELYEKYNDWAVAVTVYNMGHNPGRITDYAKDVMKNCAHWQKVVNNYI